MLRTKDARCLMATPDLKNLAVNVYILIGLSHRNSEKLEGRM